MPSKLSSDIPYFKKTTERYLKVIDHLIESGKVLHHTQFSELMGFTNSKMTKIRQGKQHVTTAMVSQLCRRYHIDPRYMFYPFQPDMFLDHKTRAAEIKRVIKVKQREIHNLMSALREIAEH